MLVRHLFQQPPGCLDELEALMWFWLDNVTAIGNDDSPLLSTLRELDSTLENMRNEIAAKSDKIRKLRQKLYAKSRKFHRT
jgi:hypothetical protein